MSTEASETESMPPDAASYRARLRVRVLKKLNIQETEYRFSVMGQEVVLSPQAPDVPIRDSEWLVLNARGFGSEEQARVFGQRLQSALHLSSAVTRLGVDPGRGLPTSALASHVKEHIAKQTGAKVRDNVHGLDVFVDDPNVVIFTFSGTGTVHANRDPFLAHAAELHADVQGLSEEARDVVLLLNFALMRPEPVAQIVFAVSAVEMLGQDEDWTHSQKTLLGELAGYVMDSKVGADEERAEVAEAVQKGLHRLSLRQGVFRLLDRLKLGHLRKEWDALYAERSSLVHGLAPRPGADYSDLANRTVNLCGHILLTRVAAEVPAVAKHMGTYYPPAR
jgi:hypothetical protein